MPSDKPQSVAVHSATDLALEEVARNSYTRLRAWLAYQWRDLAAAEDALGAALTKALTLWPIQGIPTSPDAWLLSVAKRELLQVARHQRLHNSPEVQAVLESDEEAIIAHAVPDDRLKLLFICAHPAIDPAVRPALMLQTVLGLDAQTIAQAMLTSPSAMAQRLVRAKQKIRDARLRFEEPDADELPQRLYAVLEAIYAAYGLGWDTLSAGADSALTQTAGLRDEAIFLSGLVCELLPQAQEAWGLRALILYCESRVAARYDAAGRFVPLQEQDTAHWNLGYIECAENSLRRAAAMGQPGPFQLEAAIQSAHCQRHFTGETPWAGIAMLYSQLVELAPSVGACVARAVACAHAGEKALALELLNALPQTAVASYQPYWVAQAYVASLLGEGDAAKNHLKRALGLTSSPAVRTYLMEKLDAIPVLP